jgi:hypothetical protein
MSLDYEAASKPFKILNAFPLRHAICVDARIFGEPILERLQLGLAGLGVDIDKEVAENRAREF